MNDGLQIKAYLMNINAFGDSFKPQDHCQLLSRQIGFLGPMMLVTSTVKITDAGQKS